MRSAMSIAVMNGHVEAGSILARNGANCTETEKVELGNTYTDFLLSLQLVQQPPIHKAPIQPKAPPKAVPIRPKSLPKAAPIQPQPVPSQLLQSISIQRQPILPPKAVPIQPQPIQLPPPIQPKAIASPKAASIQPQAGLPQILQPMPIQRQPTLPPKAVPIQPPPIQPAPIQQQRKPNKAQPWIQPGWFGRHFNEQREEEVKG